MTEPCDGLVLRGDLVAERTERRGVEAHAGVEILNPEPDVIEHYDLLGLCRQGTRAAVCGRRLRRRTHADLENLALELRGPAARAKSGRCGQAPEIPGRVPRCAPEGAYEVGQVAEAHL